MSINELTKYAEWSGRQFWQYQRRGSWKFAWHGDTLVRYVELAPADPDFTAGLLEYLKTPESVLGFTSGGKSYAGATVYNRPAKLEAAWKPVSAWYEQQEGQVDERTKLKVIRVYQALQKATGQNGDGPYTVENGCRYKVSFTFYWKVESLPNVPQGTSGVSYQLEQVNRDDETGLWNCCLVRRERVQQDVAEYTTDVTAFEARTEEQHLGVKAGNVAGTGKAARAGGGVLVKRQVRKNEDCTSDVVNETVTERPVEGAAKSVERTLRAETVTVEDRNMEAKLPEAGLKVGERVRNEKTPGGRWNRQRTVTTPKIPEGPIRETCQKTVFEHRHASTEVREKRPAAPEVKAAAEGKIEQETVRALDDGTYERELEERTEQAAEGAVEETRKMLRGVKRIRVNRNMAAKASAAGMRSGGTVRNERTEGGLWNQTIEETEQTPTGKIQESCQKNALQHVHQRTENVADNPGAAETAAAGGGTIHRREVRRTEEGTYDVTEVTDTAIAAEEKVECGSEKRKVERTNYRNQQQITPPAHGVNVEVSANVQKNEHGLVDGTVEVVTHEKATRTAKGGTALYDEEETSTINDEEETNEAPSEGRTVTCRTNPNEHGSATTSKIVRTAKQKHEKSQWTTTDDTWEYRHTVDVYRNWKTVPSVPSGMYQANMSLSINEFGLIDAVVTTVDRIWQGKEASEGQSFRKSGNIKKTIVYMKPNGKLYKRKVTAHMEMRREASGKFHTPDLSGEFGFGLESYDDGHYRRKFTNIEIGKEEEVK